MPPTIKKRTGHSLQNLLPKWAPPDRVKRIMDSVKQKLENPNKLALKQFNRKLNATTASFPFHPTITNMIKKSLASHDVKVTSSPGTTLRDLLTKTKTTLPPHLTPNVIYEIYCNDCTATYNGQTNRPLIKRIKEHESQSRLHLHNPDEFSHNQSAPVNLFKTDLSALIQEIDALLRASYLYLNSMPRRHFSKAMPYQLLNHLFILHLSSAGTMVTPYSLQIIPDDAELKEEEDQPVEERSDRRRRTKRKTMAELTPEGQAARRAALIAKRCRKRLRTSERKAAEKELETANSEQLRRSEGASLPVPIKSGVFPKDLEAAGPSTGRKAGKSKRKAQKANGSKNPAPKNKPDAVYPGAFEGKGKSRLKKKDNSHPSAHHPSEIVVSVKTGTATKEDLLAVTKALIEAKLSQQGPVDGAPPTQIRETSLEEGKVVVKVWDKASNNFAIKAVNKGGQYKAVAQEGRLRMAFTVTALFASC